MRLFSFIVQISSSLVNKLGFIICQFLVYFVLFHLSIFLESSPRNTLGGIDHNLVGQSWFT